jgi:hypothetical protein
MTPFCIRRRCSLVDADLQPRGLLFADGIAGYSACKANPLTGLSVECRCFFRMSMIEAGVVPVAGQGAVLDASAIQGKAHMRAAIVEREDTTFVVHDEYRSMRPVHHQRRLQKIPAPSAAASR